jgi:hypothetical protein
MKRLIDFLLGRTALKNRAGGMAWICGMDDQDGSDVLNGRAVKTVSFANGKWQIDPPQKFRATRNVHYVQQDAHVKAGDSLVVVAIVDECLQPWKDDGITRKEVADLYATQPTTRETTA